MSMRTLQRAREERELAANEINIALPVRGIRDEAQRSEVAGIVADVLENWQSNGIGISMRDGFEKISTFQAKQRIPFEFTFSDYITILDGGAICAGISYERPFPGHVSWTGISSQIIMADGHGKPLRFNGETFEVAEFTTNTGKDIEEFDGVFSHQDRPYFWDSDELTFYYGQVGAVMGPLTRFPLDRLGNISGRVAIITSQTVNAAHGMNDVLVIITTTGWVILYEGLDPGDPTDWRLLGRVKIAPPVSKFAVTQFGSDLWVLTARGIVSIRAALAEGVVSLVAHEAQAIAKRLSRHIRQFGRYPGWQMIDRTDGEHVILNMPTESGFQQMIYDAREEAWQTATYPAQWWHKLDAETDFTATDGSLNRLSEEFDDAGSPIRAVWHTGWIRIGRYSTVAYVIPTIIASGPLAVKITVLSDHNETPGDIAQAEQSITIRPENPGDPVSLHELIGIGATGRVFQLRFEVEGVGISFENLTAGMA